MKILWHSVAPWAPTGYGQQTGMFTPRIRDAGHDVAISCYYGLQGSELMWHGMRCLPSYSASYGTDTIVPHALWHFGAHEVKTLREATTRGMIITLCDVWVLDAPLLPDMAVAAWAPVDHETLPPIVANWFAQSGAIPIAMSRFGERKLTEAGLSPLYVPHGVDTSVFFPGEKAEARQAVGLPEDAFVVALVANNTGKDGSRKAFSEQIRAFAELRRRHSDAMLVLHTDVDSPVGVTIRALLADLPDGSYMYTDQYAIRKGLPPQKVADIMRAADVLTNTSWGEGFGIPIIEAQACGTPVIVTDTTAMPELVGGGWVVGGEPFWHDSQKAWAKRPYISGIVDAMQAAYDKARDEDMRARAWAHAMLYDADKVMAEHWTPVLAHLQDALERRAQDLLRAPDEASLVTRVREHDGFVWLDRGGRTDDWVAFGDHEANLQPIMEAALPETGGVFLDVGAHVGRWSIRLSRRASRVYAVEPNPAALATLRRHLAMNDINNVEIIERAAWDEPCWLALDDANQRHAGGSTRTVDPQFVWVEDHSPPLVEAGPLDDALALVELDRIDLVKLDVEGADLHALRGMRELLTRHRPTLVVEQHSQYGYYALADLEALLTELGYTWRFEMYKTAPYLICTPVVGSAEMEKRHAAAAALAD